MRLHQRDTCQEGALGYRKRAGQGALCEEGWHVVANEGNGGLLSEQEGSTPFRSSPTPLASHLDEVA